MHTSMRILRSTAAPAFVLALILAACGGGTSSPAASGADDDPAESAVASIPASAPAADDDDPGSDGGDGPAGDGAASIEVSVTGGEFEGDYTGSVPDGGCSRGATGENTFGLQYSTDEAGVDIGSLQLVVNDAEAASSGGSDDFLMLIEFGELFAGTQMEVEPPAEQGSGTVSLDDRGDTATITLDVETAEGVGIAATVECHSVFDFGG